LIALRQKSGGVCRGGSEAETLGSTDFVASPPKADLAADMRRCRRLVPDVLRHAAHRSFCRVQVPGPIDPDPFSHRFIATCRLVRRHEDRPLAVLQASDANALEPAGVPLRRRFGIGYIDRVVVVDCQPAGTAEFPILTEVRSVLPQDLYSVIVAVGD